MNNTLSKQVAIITGAASGLGLAMAKKMSESGIQLALIDRYTEGLSQIREEIRTEFEFYPIDITDEPAVKKTIEKIAQHFGRIDILVNCAGITGITNIKSHEVDTENLVKVFNVNFMGSWFTSKYTLPVMLKNNYGRILHFASIAGKEGNAGMLAYSSSKAAVIGMTKVQGKEYAETGITVNAIAPAVIKTALVDKMPEEQVKYMTDKIPMKRCGTLDELVNMACFIVSPENSFTTGFVFDLSGGRATY
ncbi:SDR family NAD(P)-dependent oxidoreductase [Flavihumibacter profundi]|uniref:SDR family NAD(P)-dependent oxidoreductase n=1 Tax=Flavihumibacter profundi TaxID=2716883 RepID=UPI001CC762FC|nr:SDR family NAD(P)-dependent oxidoreductase [Flavihumibacter profundi]MBZ5855600.1 SDR family oxidoreductase [Flavihumibacter profundi]